MSAILSQAEIDALVSGAATAPTIAPVVVNGGPQATTYNFRRPDRISKDQLRSLHFMHERFAVNVSTSLSAFLRAVTEVSVASVEQFAYSEFLMSLPDPTAFYALSLMPLEGLGALELNPSVAFPMVDRMLGGHGQTAAPKRAFTEIEQNVLDGVVTILLDHLSETWRTITDIRFDVHSRETRPQMVQVLGANEAVMALGFNLKIGNARGMLNVCIPAVAIESIEDKVTQPWNKAQRLPTAIETQRLHENLCRVPLRVTTVLETRLVARELMALEPGDVLALGHLASSPVDVHVERVRSFSGRLTTTAVGAGVMLEPGLDDVMALAGVTS